MVDLPSVPDELVTSKAPQTGISAGEITSPYALLSQNLDRTATTFGKGAEALDKIAEPFAEQAGFQAVSRGEDGSLQVAKAPIVGPAAAAYARAVKFSALSQGEAEAKRQDLLLSKQYHQDPEGYLKASTAFRESLVADYTKKGGPEVGVALGRSIDNTTTYNYRWLLLEQQRSIKHNFDQDTKATIESKKQDVLDLIATGGEHDPSGQKAVSQKLDDITHLYNERVNNPMLNAPADATKKELQDFDREVGAARFSYGVTQTLKDPNGGIVAAMAKVNAAKEDATVADPQQRMKNYFLGMATIKDYVANKERGHVLLNAQQKAADQTFEDTVIRDTAGDKTITENDIKTAPGVSAESRMRMLSWVKRDGMPEPIGRISQATTMDLFRRMNLPDDDPNKITDLRPIRDAYAPADGGQGKLKREDEEWLEKRFLEARTPEGERLTQIRASFTKAVEPSIDKSNPLLGKIDQSGKLESYRFQRFIDDKISEYRTNKKNPMDLFDPAKPDYLGKPETIEKFKVPLKTSMDNAVKNLTGQGSTITGIQVTPAPIVGRKPGESVADYLRRTGNALPGQ